jgi:succinate dehydrogenase / fumarate reductase iron-sulfur subunit
MERIMSLRDKAMEAGHTKSYGARHAEALTASVEHHGRVDEAKLPILSKGLFNVVEQLRMVPLGVRALLAGKMPPLFPKKNPGQESVRRIFEKVEKRQ